MQERPGKPQPLPLPAGERISQLPHRRVIPLGQGQDKFVYRSLFAGSLQLGLRRIPLRNAQVAGDAVAEEVRFLRHKAFHTPQISGVHLPNVPAGDAHRAAVRVPEAHQQAQQRGFAAAAAPRNAHHAALRDA